MSATHDVVFDITISLDPAPPVAAGFGTSLLLANVPLGGDRVREYASTRAAKTDVDAGALTSTIYDAIVAAFSQTVTPRPSTVKIGRVDVAGGESYVDALAACEQADPGGFYGLAIDSRDAADLEAVSADVEAKRLLFAAQSSDAGLLTADMPAGLANLATRERTIPYFHDDDTEWFAFAHLASRLAFDPDRTSAPWYGPLGGVAPYATHLTTGQRNFGVANNVNLLLPQGPSLTVVNPGKNAAGRPVYEILSRDWFQARLQSLVTLRVHQKSNEGKKIGVDRGGQALMAGEVRTQFDIGTAAGHFVDGQTEITYPAITQADIDAEEIPLQGRATFKVGGRKAAMSFSFTRTPIFEEAE